MPLSPTVPNGAIARDWFLAGARAPSVLNATAPNAMAVNAAVSDPGSGWTALPQPIKGANATIRMTILVALTTTSPVHAALGVLGPGNLGRTFDEWAAVFHVKHPRAKHRTRPPVCRFDIA